MTVSLKHSTNVVVADDGTSPVGSDEWNAEHNFTMDTGFLLGRSSTGNGAVEQLADVPSDGAWYGRVNIGTGATWVSGGTVSSNINVAKSSPQLQILSTDTTAGSLLFRRTSGTRWRVEMNANAEAGSNTGSDFQVIASTDGGASNFTSLAITRSTGLATVKGDPTTALGIATKQYVDSLSAYQLLGKATGVSCATANTDTTIAISVGGAKFWLRCLVIENTGAATNNAQCAVYMQPNGAGFNIVPSFFLSFTTVTPNSAGSAREQPGSGAPGSVLSGATNLYFRIVAAAGAGTTVNVWFFGMPLP